MQNFIPIIERKHLPEIDDNTYIYTTKGFIPTTCIRMIQAITDEDGRRMGKVIYESVLYEDDDARISRETYTELTGQELEPDNWESEA